MLCSFEVKNDIIISITTNANVTDISLQPLILFNGGFSSQLTSLT